MALPSNLTRSAPSPTSPTKGRMFKATTLPPFLTFTSSGASSQFNAIPDRCSFFGSGILKFPSSLTVQLPDCFPTRVFTTFSSKSHVRLKLGREPSEDPIGTCQEKISKLTSFVSFRSISQEKNY
ncbi:hypothetical protein ACJW31_10G057900 [Castanea mollissima]